VRRDGLVKVDAASGDETVLVARDALTGADGRVIPVQDFTLSDDESKALLFHDTERVWRANTRGKYSVLDLATGRVTAVTGGGGLMFAKFSPDGGRVAYVRANDLWVFDLATGTETRLTMDGSADIINGTTDWVYEEELGLRDAFRWSPDGTRLAYWRFDQSGVPAFPLVDELAQYPVIDMLRYPKAGAPNSRVRVGVVPAAGGPTTWLQTGDATRLIARMEWAGSDSLVVQRLPRTQEQVDLLMLSAATGTGRTVLTDRDSAYVDVEGDGLTWLRGGRQFLWRTDRSGWRQYVLYDRSGKPLRTLTRDGVDVLDLLAVDEKAGAAWFVAAGPTPTQRQVYRATLDGRRWEQVTTARGTHAWSVAPGAKYAVATHSQFGVPATAQVLALPKGTVVRTITDNADLKATLAALRLRTPEHFRVPGADGTLLDAYRIVPADFDSARAHPVLMHLYGGPAAPQVNDAWGGARYLWHQMLAQMGHVVVVVDNRGAAWRGRDFRKATQHRLGVLESDDQIAAAKWIGSQPWADASRIGIWGWSYGGFMTLMSTTRGGDVFKAGIAVAPVTDWRLYDSIYTERFMGLPSDNAEGYRLGAPQTHVDGLSARLLIVHGTGDDNVHPQNTIQMLDKLVSANKPFELLMYPNSNHAITRGNATVHLYTAMTEFLRRAL
jgi:dipeptidyl-peptidase-4